MKKNNIFFAYIKSGLKKLIYHSVYPESSTIKSTVSIPLLMHQRLYNQKLQARSSTKVAIFFDLEYLDKSAISKFSIKTFGLLPDKFHIFTEFSCSFKANEALEKIAKILEINQSHISLFDAGNYPEMDAQFNTLQIFLY